MFKRIVMTLFVVAFLALAAYFVINELNLNGDDVANERDEPIAEETIENDNENNEANDSADVNENNQDVNETNNEENNNSSLEAADDVNAFEENDGAEEEAVDSADTQDKMDYIAEYDRQMEELSRIFEDIQVISEDEDLTDADWENEIRLRFDELEQMRDEVYAMPRPRDDPEIHDIYLAAMDEYQSGCAEFTAGLDNDDEARIDTAAHHFFEGHRYLDEHYYELMKDHPY
ncbi:hypothetical protein [Salisediminibacterium halotolerans]|uniref:hypothetical protein n=1 Tax=Salisediminibacterium halotolerans TaxID=517425 RepID=UPI000EAF9035|nr:hypothetical protein [Salisediminibacterium halotolerans]RLJ75693.1 hypothetical protein BCL39_1211 [Actinophytocola xinjiangensis]RPE89547.1 hypothetical protein EDD67_0324 [Salisediminibacterium halotolerans]TWG36306.1 hypothetical protein BCL52_1208 [Salisediminibacterium halotolerans]GEL07246.1 hypothetical protein SHA02_06620 [Salisediminibacterium halotolerans]